jgi:chemotaxis protein CheC
MPDPAINLTNLEEDALMELSNMYTYHVSMALEKMIGKPVELNIKSKSIISLEDPKADQDKAPEMLLGIYSSLKEGDLDGNIVLVFPKDSVLRLYENMIKKRLGSTKIVDDSVKSVMSELGNVVSGKMLGVLNKFIGVKARHSVPSIVPSFGNHIYDYVYFNINEENKKAMLIKVDIKFLLKKSVIDGQIILLLSHKSFSGLLKKINTKANA